MKTIIMRMTKLIHILLVMFFCSFNANSQEWVARGNFNNFVYVLKAINSDTLIAGGEFTKINSLDYHCLTGLVYSLDYNTWNWANDLGLNFCNSSMQSYIKGAKICAVESFDNRIHIGGQFYHPYYYDFVNLGYIEYDSKMKEFNFETYLSRTDLPVYAFKKFNDKLFFGGEFQGFCGTNYIAYIESNNYPSPSPKTPGGGLNGTVYCLEVYNGNLYAGGSFTSSGTTTVNRIAKWNGTSWEALGTGLNKSPYCMTVYNNELIVGGYFSTAGGVTVNNIAKWNGSQWSAIGNGLTGGSNQVNALEVYNNILYAGGDFSNSGSTTLRNIAKWNNTIWKSVGTGTNAQIRCMEVFDQKLFIGGDFTEVNGLSVNYLVSYNGYLGINNDQSNYLDINIFPNPAKEKIIIETGNKDYQQKIVSLMNLYGENIYQSTETSNIININLSGIQAGVYLLEVQTEKGILTKKIIVY